MPTPPTTRMRARAARSGSDSGGAAGSRPDGADRQRRLGDGRRDLEHRRPPLHRVDSPPAIRCRGTRRRIGGAIWSIGGAPTSTTRRSAATPRSRSAVGDARRRDLRLRRRRSSTSRSPATRRGGRGSLRRERGQRDLRHAHRRQRTARSAATRRSPRSRRTTTSPMTRPASSTTRATSRASTPRLAPLADNGGPTNTHALYTGSPAHRRRRPSRLPGRGPAPLRSGRTARATSAPSRAASPRPRRRRAAAAATQPPPATTNCRRPSRGQDRQRAARAAR